jgi:hypothetical protein
MDPTNAADPEGINGEAIYLAPYASRRGEVSPPAGIIDSQSAKTTQKGGVDGPTGYEAVNGRKRHVLLETLGLLMSVAVHPADATAPHWFSTRVREPCPFIERVFAALMSGIRGQG